MKETIDNIWNASSSAFLNETSNVANTLIISWAIGTLLGLILMGFIIWWLNKKFMDF